ncbi:MAG: CAP domain-containing protein [Candidatus Binatia bacterium]
MMFRGAILVSSILIAFVSAAQGASIAQAEKEPRYPELVEIIHKGVNEFRRSQGLKPLEVNPIIGAQAQAHSSRMARNGESLSHRGFDLRMKEIGKKLVFRSAAENVATNFGYEDPGSRAVEGWKNSPGHRKNMLGDFTLTGIGVARTREGAYYYTQIFLKP